MTSVLCIANPTAGAPGAREAPARTRRRDALLNALRGRGLAVELALTRGPGDATALARAAAGYDTVLALGGDGTASEVATGLVALGERAPAFAAGGFGTGNDFAHLAGTADDAALVEAVAAPHRHAIDVLGVHDAKGERVRVALLYAAVGFPTELQRRTTPRIKRLFGPRLCYTVGLLLALRSYRAPDVTLTIEHADAASQDIAGPMLAVLAANAPTAGGGQMRIGPHARLDDGRMDLSVIDAVPAWETLRQLARLRDGTHIQHPRVRYVQCTAAAIATTPRVQVAVDGDEVGDTPVRIAVLPRALCACGRGFAGP